jgi:hypothetical protein
MGDKRRVDVVSATGAALSLTRLQDAAGGAALL